MQAKTIDIILKHYVPLTLIFITIIFNYVVYTSSAEVGVFYAKIPDTLHPPYRTEYSILVMDLLDDSRILVDHVGVAYSLSYVSDKCDSCIIYIEEDGLDVYVLIITIASIILYIYALKKIWLNKRYLLLTLVFIGILYASLITYIEYSSIPYTDYVYVKSSKPVLLENSTGTAIIDTDLKPNTLITIRSKTPVAVLYLEIVYIGGKPVVKDSIVKASFVNEYSDYITGETKYNAVAVTTLSNKTAPEYIYKKISITYIKPDLPIINYTPLVVLIVAIIYVEVSAMKTIGKINASKNSEKIEQGSSSKPQRSSIDPSDQALQPRNTS